MNQCIEACDYHTSGYILLIVSVCLNPVFDNILQASQTFQYKTTKTMSMSDNEDDWIDDVQHREGFVLDQVSRR